MEKQNKKLKKLNIVFNPEDYEQIKLASKKIALTPTALIRSSAVRYSQKILKMEAVSND